MISKNAGNSGGREIADVLAALAGLEDLEVVFEIKLGQLGVRLNLEVGFAEDTVLLAAVEEIAQLGDEAILALGVLEEDVRRRALDEQHGVFEVNGARIVHVPLPPVRSAESFSDFSYMEISALG